MKKISENIQALKDFFKKLILDSRREFETLDDLERKQIGNRLRYESPCQIEIFWVDEPLENYLIVVLHDPRRPDLEITVNGPFKGVEIIPKTIEIMNQPRWQMEAPYDRDKWPNESVDVGDLQNKYSDFFVLAFTNFVNHIRNQPFMPVKRGLGFGATIRKNDFYFSIIGNIGSLSREDLQIYDPIYFAKRLAEAERKLKSSGTQSSSQCCQEKQTVKLRGAYLSPPVRIGDNVERNFEEKLIDQIGKTYYPPKCDYEFFFQGKPGFYYSYGFIAIQEDDAFKAKSILNTIFGVVLITGFPVDSLKDSDLWEISMDPETKGIGTFFAGSIDSDSDPFKSKGIGKYAISLLQMTRIIKIAESIYPHEKIRDSLLFLIESHTHLKDREYSQSFIFSWLIAEMHISKLFEKFLSEKNVTGKRKEKFRNHDKWSSESRLELLDFNEKIEHKEYLLLIEFNTKRNNFVHKGENVEKTDAEKLFEYCQNLMKYEIEGIPVSP